MIEKLSAHINLDIFYCIGLVLVTSIEPKDAASILTRFPGAPLSFQYFVNAVRCKDP